ncbi:hypothetical protein D3C81_900890 [compost metagenome]
MDKDNYKYFISRVESLIERWNTFAEKQPDVPQEELIKRFLLEVCDRSTLAMIDPKAEMFNYKDVGFVVQKPDSDLYIQSSGMGVFELKPGIEHANRLHMSRKDVEALARAWKQFFNTELSVVPFERTVINVITTKELSDEQNA